MKLEFYKARRVLQHVFKQAPAVLDLFCVCLSKNGTCAELSISVTQTLELFLVDESSLRRKSFTCVSRKTTWKKIWNKMPGDVASGESVRKSMFVSEIEDEVLRHEAYAIFLDKLLEAARGNDVAVLRPWLLDSSEIVVLRKGTTLEQILVEMDLQKMGGE